MGFGPSPLPRSAFNVAARCRTSIDSNGFFCSCAGKRSAYELALGRNCKGIAFRQRRRSHCRHSRGIARRRTFTASLCRLRQNSMRSWNAACGSLVA